MTGMEDAGSADGGVDVQRGEPGPGVEPAAVRVVHRPVPRRGGARCAEFVEGAAVEQQRLGVAALRVDDLADVDDVVAAVVLAPRNAGQGCRCSGEHRCGGAVLEHRAGGLRPAGEVQGGVDLVGGEDVHRERRAGEEGARLGRPGQGDLAQAGLEGDRGERGDRCAVRGALVVGAGDHGDATCELSEDVSEPTLIHFGAPCRSFRRDVM
ncbi:hypothetical protein RHRU231_360041 [Rhodococcus ruber]|uniref:Uncharacterized protein n=1 Tax=Rhodococcus ruber TaxID=1830 RepID=A0A098BJR2_9NOCA|nr:hypothetical protein RHRU231_360041 [Rhodococcus ruber]